ncbi:MAG: Glycine cleavage system H protein [Phycisphaerales bacterium]|nr:Glycine cleavage system H protein [Phycisphaerales bacterium]
MDARAVAYKLCDRGFDCDHCPFDCAMRGCPLAAAAQRAQADPPWNFPADRLYTTGHVWVQEIEASLVRAGIDAFAARLLAPVHGITCPPHDSPHEHASGAAWCELESTGGFVPLSLPVPGTVARWNTAVLESPSLVGTDPYGTGWIAEIVTDVDRLGAGLYSWQQAAERAAHDAHFLQHQIAFHLLAATDPARVPFNSVLVEAGRDLLTPGPFVALARQILH